MTPAYKDASTQHNTLEFILFTRKINNLMIDGEFKKSYHSDVKFTRLEIGRSYSLSFSKLARDSISHTDHKGSELNNMNFDKNNEILDKTLIKARTATSDNQIQDIDELENPKIPSTLLEENNYLDNSNIESDDKINKLSDSIIRNLHNVENLLCKIFKDDHLSLEDFTLSVPELHVLVEIFIRKNKDLFRNQ